MKEKTVDLRTGSNRVFHPGLIMTAVRVTLLRMVCQVVSFIPS